MSRIRTKILGGLVLLAVFFTSAAWGATPDKALSSKPANSIYAVLNVDDLGGLARTILSDKNIELFAPLMDEDTLNGFRMAAAIVGKMPVKTTALVTGMDENLVPFLQIAMALPAELQPKLKLVEEGKAKPEDITSLILGDGALALGPLLNAVPQKGTKGSYFLINGQAAVTAKDGLLLIGLSAQNLEASLKALEGTGDPLSVKPRHEGKDFARLHIDFSTLVKIAMEQKAREGAKDKKLDDLDPDVLKKYFKAPLEIEYNFDKKPDRFLVSFWANVEEALSDAYVDRLRRLAPVPGGDVFLTGAGRPLFALSSKLSIKGSDFEIYPEIAEVWKKGMKKLAGYGITEAEIENLLSGSISLVCGGTSSFAGAKTPGLYLAVTGQKGAALSIFEKVTQHEDFSMMVPTAPVEVAEWHKMLQVDPQMLPAPVLLGIKGETFFLGTQDPKSLSEAPELSERLKALLEKTSMGTSFIDFESIQAFLNGAVNDQGSPLYSLLASMPPAMLDLVKDVLGAELSIPFIGVWTPQFDTAFAEHELVDVPADKGLMARIVKAASQFKSASEPSPLDRLQNVKTVVEPVFKANPEIDDAALKELAKETDMAVVLLKKDEVLYLGTVADAAFRDELTAKAKQLKLRGSAGLDILPANEDYAGQEIVWMAVAR